jgi:hypothetical protein
MFVAAMKWRDGATGQHVEYDQKPDVFRYIYLNKFRLLVCCDVIDILRGVG